MFSPLICRAVPLIQIWPGQTWAEFFQTRFWPVWPGHLIWSFNHIFANLKRFKTNNILWLEKVEKLYPGLTWSVCISCTILLNLWLVSILVHYIVMGWSLCCGQYWNEQHLIDWFTLSIRLHFNNEDLYSVTNTHQWYNQQYNQ